MKEDDKGKRTKLTLVEKLLALLFAIIIITMFSQVVFRYIFNQSLYWSEEIVRYLFVWLVFFGGALVIREDGHIGIDFLLTKIPDKYSRKLKYLDYYVSIIVNLFFAIAGTILIFKLRGPSSPALGLPVNWFLYGALPMASIISIYYIYLKFKKARNSENNLSEEADSV